MPLAVNVAADGDGRRHGLHVGFLQQSFARQFRQSLDFGFRQRCALVEFGEPGFEIGVGVFGGGVLRQWWWDDHGGLRRCGGGIRSIIAEG